MERESARMALTSGGRPKKSYGERTGDASASKAEGASDGAGGEEENAGGGGGKRELNVVVKADGECVVVPPSPPIFFTVCTCFCV